MGVQLVAGQQRLEYAEHYGIPYPRYCSPVASLDNGFVASGRLPCLDIAVSTSQRYFGACRQHHVNQFYRRQYMDTPESSEQLAVKGSG